MNRSHRLLLAAGCVAAASLAPALAADEHAGHHAAAPASTPAAGAPSPVAEQLKAMQAMHDKMAKATSTEERRALLDEQMKTLQAAMASMEAMGAGEPPAAASGASKGMGMGMGSGHTAAQAAAMAERMAMMQMMMRMMVDRLSVDAR